MGLAESELQDWMESVHFKSVEISVVAREEEPRHFETLLAGGEK